MSTSIVVVSTRQELARCTYAPSEEMYVALTDAVSTAKIPGGLASCVVKDVEYGDIVRVVPGRRMGTRPLCVEAQVEAITSLQLQPSALKDDHEELKADHKELKADHKRLKVLFSKNQLRTCAGQTLSVALAFTDLKQTTSTRTVNLGSDNEALGKLSTMASKPPERFALIADGIITRRNNDGAHWTTLEQLDAEVEVCKELLQDPVVKQSFKWEAWVIENYEQIKIAFPDRFVAASA